MMAKKNTFNLLLSILIMLTLVYCGGSDDSGGGSFGKPAQPVLNPSGGQFSNPIDDNDRLFVTITSQNDVRYTSSLSGVPEDPECGSVGIEYAGPFQIGGPNETVRIKAIACEQDNSSVVTSSEEYVFGP
ncbi:hypothetical protein MRY82_01445 [bacterium]|nr:hypothetical protein [bacterium]